MNPTGWAIAIALMAATATAPAVRTTTETYAPPPITWPTEYGPCAEWAPLAFEVGWSPDQWPTLSAILWCESRCNPRAHNASGAAGLAQVMPMWWRGRDPYDPRQNLTMAHEVYERQGWRAWECYR
jgi:hypothetical protein